MRDQQPTDSVTALKDIAMSAVIEQRRRRRWGIFFKLIILVYFSALLALMYFPNATSTGKLGKKHAALIDIDGAILPGTPISADNIARGLQAAFKDKNTQGVILRINSPGGSPVQSDYVFNEIKRLRTKYPDIKLYAVCSDMCTSGAYYIAAAADKIYANPSSIVGSIGVLMNGFGFVDTLTKVGMSRRLITAGDHKGILDPFSPMKQWDQDYAKRVLNEVHQTFIQQVKSGRGNRLNVNYPDLFSGLFWTGADAKKIGLIDNFASAGSVARDVIKNEHIVNYTVQQSLLERLTERFGASLSKQIGVLLGISKTNRLS